MEEGEMARGVARDVVDLVVEARVTGEAVVVATVVVMG